MASICDNASQDSTATPMSSALSSSEDQPLLRIPTDDAPRDEWAAVIPISDLPSLPDRGSGYYFEPICGVVMVSVICVTLVGITTTTSLNAVADRRLAWVLTALIWTWAALALGTMSFILFAQAGVLKRSPQSCYPVPQEVASRLLEGKSLSGLKNISSDAHGTYCVRCCIWRTKHGENHHCNTCQRCVCKFDHHCGVFGRCIVGGNMPCFIIMVAMCFCGMATTMVTIMGAGADTAATSYPQGPYNVQRAPVTIPQYQPPVAIPQYQPTAAPYDTGALLL